MKVSQVVAGHSDDVVRAYGEAHNDSAAAMIIDGDNFDTLVGYDTDEHQHYGQQHRHCHQRQRQDHLLRRH